MDEPTEGLPPYLAGPMINWLREAFADGYSGGFPEGRIRVLQLRFKLDPPLDWSRGAPTALSDLLTRVGQDAEFGLDVIDFVLAHIGQFADRYSDPASLAGDAGAILQLGGSAWEVTSREEGGYQLSRRAVGPVREAIESVPSTTRAHQHLVTAWNHLSGRNPNASAGYRDAVKAVEAAAKPIILPKNDRATLGQMIAALRDKPEKWRTTVGSVDLVREMMDTVWTNQLDRHGTDDDSVPLTVSADQADAAFALCLGLCRLFAGGHIEAK